MEYSVVIPAAGSGTRMQLGYNKLFYNVNGMTILEHTIRCFTSDHKCRQIIVVHSQEDEQFIKERLAGYAIELVVGGKQRADSVYAGLKQVNQRYVLIHDGARPFLKQQHIDMLLETLREYRACILAVPCKDTIKVVHHQEIVATPERATLWQAQTPQAFYTELILHAYKQALDASASITDDASAVEQFSDQSVRVVMGSYDNIKITTEEDLRLLIK